MKDCKTINLNPYHIEFKRGDGRFVMKVHATTIGRKCVIVNFKMDWWFWVYIVREFTAAWVSEKQNRREMEGRIDASLPQKGEPK